MLTSVQTKAEPHLNPFHIQLFEYLLQENIASWDFEALKPTKQTENLAYLIQRNLELFGESLFNTEAPGIKIDILLIRYGICKLLNFFLLPCKNRPPLRSMFSSFIEITKLYFSSLSSDTEIHLLSPWYSIWINFKIQAYREMSEESNENQTIEECIKSCLDQDSLDCLVPFFSEIHHPIYLAELSLVKKTILVKTNLLNNQASQNIDSDDPLFEEYDTILDRYDSYDEFVESISEFLYQLSLLIPVSYLKSSNFLLQ